MILIVPSGKNMLAGSAATSVPPVGPTWKIGAVVAPSAGTLVIRTV
jgi:hypothetical protein